MTNYNERLDDVLFSLCDLSYASFATQEEADRVADQLDYDRAEAKQAIVEWHEIEMSEVYNSGCADTAKHILALFDNQIPEQLKQWLRLEIEDRGKL